MDNICHTLAGAVLAEAGLRRRTPLALPTLLIGANLPDLDALAYLRDPLVALTIRRGWTHGILGLLVLPVLLAGAMLAWDRLARRGRGERADPRALLLVAGVGVLSHPVLDLLNTYGVRLLMPFSARWFSADTLFIVDPWLWLLFGAGGVIAWRRRRRGLAAGLAERPARLALAGAGIYLVAMGTMAVIGRRVVREAAAAAGVTEVRHEMVAPVPVNPFRRTVVLEAAGSYRFGSLRWLESPLVVLDSAPMATGLDSPAAVAAAHSRAGAAFLSWSRFPAAVVRGSGAGAVVRLYDLRYAGPSGESWAAVEVPLPTALRSPPFPPAPAPPPPAPR